MPLVRVSNGGSTVKSIVFRSSCGSGGSTWAYYWLYLPVGFVGRIQKNTGSTATQYYAVSTDGSSAKFILDIKSWTFDGSDPTSFTFDFQAGLGSGTWGAWVYNQTYTIIDPQDATQLSEKVYSNGSKMSFFEVGRVVETY